MCLKDQEAYLCNLTEWEIWKCAKYFTWTHTDTHTHVYFACCLF